MTAGANLNKTTNTTAQTAFNSSLDEAICTLYEKRYHYGVAAFVNSLALKGY